MKVFTCKDRFEDMMTCVYEAWSEALKIGHKNVCLEKEPLYQQDLFNEYVHVDYDEMKAEKVVRSIQEKISKSAYISVFYASLSHEEDALQTIYEFLRVGFRAGAKVMEMHTNPWVLRMMEIRRCVGNEASFFREVARFTSVGNQVYLCHLEPKDNILILTAEHFADRMPSEHWIMVDEKRKYAVIHPRDEEFYRQDLSDEEFERLKEVYSMEDSYTDLWRTFFEATSITQRENKKCQRNMFPIWMRKNAVEFYGNQG